MIKAGIYYNYKRRYYNDVQREDNKVKTIQL